MSREHVAGHNCDLARIDLNDPAGKIDPNTLKPIPPRSTDAELLKFANDGIDRALELRPDLKYGRYGAPLSDLALSDPFPLPIEYRPAIAAYIVSRNQRGDDAFVIEQRDDKSMADFINNLGI